jgi:hypothetical protein
MKKWGYKSLALFLFAVLCTACVKEEDISNGIPYAKVDIDVNMLIENGFNNMYYSKKYYSNQGGVAYAGYAGVLAISLPTQDATLWLYAFDLCCPYEAPAKNELQLEGTFKLKCPQCGTIYDLSNRGRVVPGSGKGTQKLTEYNVFKDGSFYRIRN